MTLTNRSTGLAALTFGVVALAAFVFATVSVAPAHAASICPGTTFSMNLKKGSTGTAVMQLQQFLNSSPDTMIASVGAGSPGNETTYLGPLTTAAIKKFQTKYASNVLAPVGLSVATGYWGPSSRAEANALCAGTTSGSTTGGSTGTGTTTTGTAAGTAVVSVAAQPANSVAPKLASRVPFTTFTVTANGAPVTLNSVSIVRQGPSLDTDFSGVELINVATGQQMGISHVFDANHSATIGQPITIPAGTSMTFQVAGNIASSVGSGDVASIAVTAINTSSSVSGSLPITGASVTMNSTLTIGTNTVSFSSFDPRSSSSQPIGTSGYRFSAIRLQAGSAEDQTLKSITWYQSGSASGVSNVVTVVNGTSYPTTVDATGRYYTSTFPSGIVIPKGQSLDLYVQGDLSSNTNANSTAEFDIYRATDIYLVGNTYGYGITPTATGSGTYSTTNNANSGFQASSNPFYFGATVTVTAGSISTFQNATSVAAQNIGVNVLNQPLGGFQTNLTGESITAQSVTVHFHSSASISPLTNVSLVNQNGSVIAGPYNATCNAGATSCTDESVTFTGAINFPTGAATYTLQGEVPSGTAGGVTIQASTTPSTDWSSVTGNTTGNTISLPSNTVTMNTMTVQAATLNATNGTTPVSQNVVAGGSNVVFATVSLDASQSGEDIRLSSIPLDLTFSGTNGQLNLSACQIYNGSTALNTGTRVINGSNINTTSGGKTNFSLDNSLVIPKGTILSLNLQCSVSSSATGTYQWGVDSTAGDWSVSGSVSGSSVTPTFTGVGTAPTMTISSGATLAASIDPSSPSYTLVAGGTTGALLNVIKLHAANEPVNLQKIALSLTTATASSSAADLSNVYLYAGNNVYTTGGAAVAPGTLLGTMQFPSGSTVATSTLSTVVQLPNNQDAQILVKGDIAAVGSFQPATEGDLVAVDLKDAQGVGANSGTTIYSTGTTASSGVRVFHSVPTVALGSGLTSNGVSDGHLIRFSISAGSQNPIGINQLVFGVATTSATVSNVNLYAYTDSGYSQPVPGFASGVLNSSALSVLGTTGSQKVTVVVNNGTGPLEIPAGGTYYFSLVGTVAGSGTTYNVSTTLNGDAAYPTGLTSGNMGTVSQVNGSNFVWSPNATTTTVTTVSDWTNGYGVAGLPSVGITQNRTN